MVSRGMVEDPVSNPVLDFGDRITELFHDSLTLQSLDGVRVGGSRHDDESDDGGLGTGLLQSVIQSLRLKRVNIVRAIKPEMEITHEQGIQ